MLIFLGGAGTGGRSGNGEPSWRAKWCTRKYAPSRPSSSAATASSIDCRRTSDAVRALECRDGVQCPKERKPSFFTKGPQRMKPLLYPSELRGHSPKTTVHHFNFLQG